MGASFAAVVLDCCTGSPDFALGCSIICVRVRAVTSNHRFDWNGPFVDSDKSIVPLPRFETPLIGILQLENVH